MHKSASITQKPRVSLSVVPKGRKFLKPEEARRLIASAGSRGRQRFRDRILVQMAFRHGMRASEVCRVRWADVDLDDGCITVQRQKHGNRSTHPMDRDELRDLRKLRKVNTGPFVFESEQGGPPSVDTLARVVKEAGQHAGLGDHIHPHMLRHAAGYLLVNEGVDTRFIQDFLGHKSMQTTVLYTELSPKRLAAFRVR